MLPVPVQDLCDHFLLLAERQLPSGLLTGLYLHGGVVFGEWAPWESDVGLLATLAHRRSSPQPRTARRHRPKAEAEVAEEWLLSACGAGVLYLKSQRNSGAWQPLFGVGTWTRGCWRDEASTFRALPEDDVAPGLFCPARVSPTSRVT